VTRVDYDRRLYRAYRAGRALSADTGRLWMAAIAGHLGGVRAKLTMLDLGAGTGRFSALLADAFDARVVAVEPSAKMRAEAARDGSHPRVVYRDGAADVIPAIDGEFDVAFLSMVIHHVPDPAACARELYRVVKPGGLVFIRNTFSGRLDGVPHYQFFPAVRAVDETRLPRVEHIRDAFGASGFEFVALDAVEQQIDPSLGAPSSSRPRRFPSSIASTSSSFVVRRADGPPGVTRYRARTARRSRSSAGEAAGTSDGRPGSTDRRDARRRRGSRAACRFPGRVD
jgi:ubiquinone/menaquinone biosynthesis C-methylase UbiE